MTELWAVLSSSFSLLFWKPSQLNRWLLAYIIVYVCVCVCEREREREWVREKEREYMCKWPKISRVSILISSPLWKTVFRNNHRFISNLPLYETQTTYYNLISCFLFLCFIISISFGLKYFTRNPINISIPSILSSLLSLKNNEGLYF